VIRSFADKDTRRLFDDEDVRRFRAIADVARRKLYLLHATVRLDDLRVPPGNRLEPLHGDRGGQHGIRINQQFRLCFRWIDGHAHDVEIVDYH
jgi:proteic killer suppression protein